MSTIDAVEDAFAAAWEAHNRAEIVAIRQAEDPSAVAAARAIAKVAIDAAVEALASLEIDDLDAEDGRALASMRETLDLLASDDPMLTWAIDTTDPDDRSAADILATDGLGALLGTSAAAFTRAADDLRFDGRPTDRIEILGQLATEPDPATRRRLFLALEPMWRAVDADGGPGSPYRIALRASAEAWRRDGSPVDANARALGVDPSELEPWLRAILAAWRDAAVGPAGGAAIEPWDERYATGAFSRAFDADLSLAELRRIDRAYYASLGADPDALGIHYDIEPRPGRGPVAMAFMLDVGIPRRGPDGWTTGEQWVVASYSRPRVPDLAELLHETGHAIHAWAIRTRPAFAVMTEAYMTLIEALGDIVAWDLYEPAWQARWLGRSASVGGRSPRAVRRCRPGRRLVAVRDRPSPDSRARPERGLGRDRERLPGGRPTPGVVLVGGPRSARPDAGLHGQLRARRGRDGGHPSPVARSPRRLARRRPRLERGRQRGDLSLGW